MSSDELTRRSRASGGHALHLDREHEIIFAPGRYCPSWSQVIRAGAVSPSCVYAVAQHQLHGFVYGAQRMLRMDHALLTAAAASWKPACVRHCWSSSSSPCVEQTSSQSRQDMCAHHKEDASSSAAAVLALSTRYKSLNHTTAVPPIAQSTV